MRQTRVQSTIPKPIRIVGQTRHTEEGGCNSRGVLHIERGEDRELQSSKIKGYFL